MAASVPPTKSIPSGGLSGCFTADKLQPSPELAPYNALGLSLPAGRIEDLNQLPFSQQLKFFKEFSSINQLDIFKPLSSHTFSEQSACLHCCKGWKLISSSWDLSILQGHGASNPKQSWQIQNPVQTQSGALHSKGWFLQSHSYRFGKRQLSPLILCFPETPVLGCKVIDDPRAHKLDTLRVGVNQLLPASIHLLW